MKLQTFVVEITWLHGVDHGFGNGYVVLPPSHPMFGKDYDGIPVEVHGGLTYAKDVTNFNTANLPEGVELPKEGWVVGFDAAHYQDNAENWPKSRVEEETARLAAQLEAM